MSISRAAGAADTSCASRSRSSVVLPMADTTTTTSSPARRVATMCCATALIRAGSATDVPPNFCTTSATDDDGTSGFSVISRWNMGCVDSAAVSKAAKRERQRQNRVARKEYEEAVAKRRRFWRSARTFALLLIPIIVLFVFLALRNGGDDNKDNKKSSASTATTTTTTATSDTTTPPTTLPTKQTYASAPPFTIDPAKNYVATVDTNEGSFQITLDPKVAPQTVNSFVFLANNGFYDGLPFHRVVKDFVIQGGDPKGNGTGGPGYTVPDEPPKDGYTKYSVAMANSGSGTTGSQFFIVTSDKGAKALGGPPYKYSDVGKVTSGTETVDKINSLASASDGPPTQPAFINKITIAES
jgi:cyclophilin family peptidyl-prolyl cis-trans isomerase